MNNVETKLKNLILERKITSMLNEFIKQDIKDTLNFIQKLFYITILQNNYFTCTFFAT